LRGRFFLQKREDYSNGTVLSLAKGKVVLVALCLLNHIAHGLGDIHLCAIGGFNLYGLNDLAIHGGHTITFLFAASKACNQCNDSNYGQYFLHCFVIIWQTASDVYFGGLWCSSGSAILTPPRSIPDAKVQFFYDK